MTQEQKLWAGGLAQDILNDKPVIFPGSLAKDLANFVQLAIADNARLSAEVERLKPYAWHWRSCEKEIGSPVCTCGFEGAK